MGSFKAILGDPYVQPGLNSTDLDTLSLNDLTRRSARVLKTQMKSLNPSDHL